MNIQEVNTSELLKSTVDAFPNTTKRQYATDTIKITYLHWMPYLGVKTLFVKGTAHNEGREYNPIILFKNVSYHESRQANSVTLVDNVGKRYFLEQLSTTDTDILVRCNCKDFYWRGNWFNKLEGCLYGTPRKKYEAKYNPGSSNPKEMPIMCKHLIKMMKALLESNIIK